ncbi:MAG: hypothetical protein WC975_14215 [Phycisphaerae bacterium]
MKWISALFDIPERIRMGYEFLVGNLDQRFDYFPTFTTILTPNNPMARHDFPDFGDLTSRYLEGLYLARNMIGSRVDGQILNRLENLFVSFFRHEDGLNYRPPVDHPFFSELGKKPYQADIAEGFEQSRVMLTLVTWYLYTRDSEVRDRMDKLIEGIRTKAVHKDNYMYFTRPGFPPGFRPSPEESPYLQQLYFAGTQIQPLIKWYEITGSELALDTARRLYHFLTRDFFYFGPDGSFQALDVVPPGSWDRINGHTHSRLGTIAGLLKYGNVLSDQDAIAFGKQSFDWFYRNYCLQSGWCPEFLGRFPIEQEGCETCTLMDLIFCCLELCAAGYESYWDIIERVFRNQLLEQQITDTTFLGTSDLPRGDVFQEYPVRPGDLLGAFGGWCGVNDFIGANPSGWRLMNCCSPSGIKAIYLAWHNAIQFHDGRLQINLLLSRRSKYADVISFDPVAGRVEVKPHRNCILTIRLPDWVEKDQVHLEVNGKHRPIVWQRFSLVVGAVGPNEKVVVAYPLRKIKTIEKAGSIQYTMDWIGNTVMDVSPPGRFAPLYQRKDLRSKIDDIKQPDFVPEGEVDL